ncbi:NADP-dependent oxidoreductase domain-containing protein [Lipomyces japonicus]|uniref:NADP-dependent oxidoreductase domain-containing protein n=1 Tax=Lipomyces japonicus TaxID=56871 RepID=UPI0034CDCC4C
MTVDVILGTAGFGQHGRITTTELAHEFLQAFKRSGYSAVDTAYIYPGGFQGESEAFLGQLDAAEHGFVIDTKVRSFELNSHASQNIVKSVDEQFKRLGVTKVRTLYLHSPDRSTPFEETHRTMDELYRQGKFEQFGLSNYRASDVELFVRNAELHDWVKPTVYQGLYNIVSRLNEAELLPILKRCQIKFYAYSPLAVGFFSNVKLGQESISTPVAPKDFNTPFGQRLRARYFKQSFFNAVAKIETVGAKHEISNNAIALRWLRHHSQLADQDAIIIGASNIQQVEQNLESLSEGTLPAEILQVLDEVWESVKDDSPSYSR